MPSAAIASVILLVAIISSATVIYSTISANYDIIRKAEASKNEIDMEQLHTIIEIINVTYSVGKISINSTNNGSTEIDVNDIDVIIDGVYYTDNITSTTISGANVTLWLPEETLKIEVTSDSAPSRVKLVAHNGISDYWGS